MSVFPDAIDSDLELPRVENNVSEISGDTINSVRDSVLAIENAIGINPQGNTADLTTRIGLVIDADGRVKASALASSGLVTLPISNSQIGVNAAIEESKLDLDYPTATLNASLGTISANLSALITTINSLAYNTASHYAGTGNKHKGTAIDLVSPILGGTNVESALGLVNTALSSHTASTLNSHTASSISLSGPFINIDSDDVEEAIGELDIGQSAAIEEHQDKLHRNGIVIGERSSSQINSEYTTFAGTIYQTDTDEATNIFQIMRPNVARISSKNIDLRALSSTTARNLRIQAGGVGRGTLDVDLVSTIPADSIDEIVEVINTQAREQHYPISAYNTGALTLAHNIPGAQYTLEVLDTISLDASNALGFSGITNVVCSWPDNVPGCFVSGKKISGIKSIVSCACVQTSLSPTINPAVGNLSLLGLSGNEGRVLCNITNHSTDSTVNGTYYIINYPTTSTITLNDDIAAGTFDLEIAADSINFENSARGELFDIFVEHDPDGYIGHGVLKKYNRVSYGTIPGVVLKCVSNDFVDSGDFEWGVSSSGYLTLYHNGNAGVSKGISTGYVGQIEVFAPNNTTSAVFQVHGNFSAARKEFNVSEFAGSDDKLYLGSIHYGGNFGLQTIKYFMDSRVFGSTQDTESNDVINKIKTDDLASELRNNGVIRGFDIESYLNTSLRVRGGRALISGKIIDVETKDVTVDVFTEATRMLLLDINGDYLIKDTANVGFSFDELTSGTNFGDEAGVALICEFNTDGSKIDGYVTDRRLFVNKIDKRLNDLDSSLGARIENVLSTVSGGYWGFTIAETANEDGYIAELEMANHDGFNFVPDTNQTEYSAWGFGAGESSITTRRFQFVSPSLNKTSIFKSVGLTHINVFLDATYTGDQDGILGPFGVSGTVYVDIGVAVTVGLANQTTTESYALVKTINAGVFPVISQIERYVASIPATDLNLQDNVMFDVVPRIRIRNTNYVDGGTGPDPEPTILFDNVRVVTSSYSVAGSVGDIDGTSTSVGVAISDIL